MKVPSRSPSPLAVKGPLTLDGTEVDNRLDDDVDINDMMKGKT